MIEPLADQPAGKTIEQWLEDVGSTTVLVPMVSQEWIVIDGIRSLKVINGARGAQQSENIYLVRGAKTFAIRSDANLRAHSDVQRIISSFHFSKQ
jgi:hypothetical protein